MTDKEKQDIEAMSYEDMLREWRMAPVGSPRFCGERGDYFAMVMHRKRAETPDAEKVAISKRIGFDT